MNESNKGKERRRRRREEEETRDRKGRKKQVGENITGK